MVTVIAHIGDVFGSRVWRDPPVSGHPAGLWRPARSTRGPWLVQRDGNGTRMPHYLVVCRAAHHCATPAEPIRAQSEAVQAHTLPGGRCCGCQRVEARGRSSTVDDYRAGLATGTLGLGGRDVGTPVGADLAHGGGCPVLLCAAEAGCVIASATVTWQSCDREISAVGANGEKPLFLCTAPEVCRAQLASGGVAPTASDGSAGAARVVRELVQRFGVGYLHGSRIAWAQDPGHGRRVRGVPGRRPRH